MITIEKIKELIDMDCIKLETLLFLEYDFSYLLNSDEGIEFNDVFGFSSKKLAERIRTNPKPVILIYAIDISLRSAFYTHHRYHKLKSEKIEFNQLISRNDSLSNIIENLMELQKEYSGNVFVNIENDYNYENEQDYMRIVQYEPISFMIALEFFLADPKVPKKHKIIPETLLEILKKL